MHHVHTMGTHKSSMYVFVNTVTCKSWCTNAWHTIGIPAALPHYKSINDQYYSTSVLNTGPLWYEILTYAHSLMYGENNKTYVFQAPYLFLGSFEMAYASKSSIEGSGRHNHEQLSTHFQSHQSSAPLHTGTHYSPSLLTGSLPCWPQRKRITSTDIL